MSAMTSEITVVSIICLAVCSGTDQRKHPRSASLAFVRGNPPFDDVFMRLRHLTVLMNLQTINVWNLKALHSRSFVREIHGWAVDSPYKGPAIWNTFRCHDPRGPTQSVRARAKCTGCVMSAGDAKCADAHEMHGPRFNCAGRTEGEGRNCVERWVGRTADAPPPHLPFNAHAMQPRFHSRGLRWAAITRHVKG